MRFILKTACTAILLLGVAPSSIVRAQQPAGAGSHSDMATATAPHPTTAPQTKATLADFAWLEGRWRGDWGPRVAEQSWFAPKAGVMTGLFQLVEGDKTLVLELYTLIEKPDGIAFYFRHFTPELVPWEKNGATALNLAHADAKGADFENAASSQPKRTMLIRVDADTYTARSEIITEAGDAQVIEITYHREKPVPEKPSAGNGARR